MAEPKVVTTLSAATAGTEKSPVLHATGAQVTMDYIEYLAAQGYVFVGGTGAQTANSLAAMVVCEVGADNQDVDLTQPSFFFNVPDGTTVIPLFANVVVEVGTGTDNIMAIVAGANTTDGYTSGGSLAVNPRNLRTDNPRASTVTTYAEDEGAADLVVVTPTSPRVLWLWSSPTSVIGGDPFIIEWKPEHLTSIVGPGTFNFYCHSIATAANIKATFYWAELPNGLVTQTI